MRRRRATAVGLTVGVVVAVMVAMLSGAVAVTFSDIWHMVAVKTGISDDPERLTDDVLWAIRLPRVVAGLVVGGALAAAGVGLQGTFRNPLADPHLVGISPAAGLGAVTGIALTPAGSGPLPTMIGAAVGAVAMGFVIRAVARTTLDPSRLILVGLALGLALLAVLGAVVLAWDSPRVPTFLFWVFGGLSGATWSAVLAALPVALIGFLMILRLGPALDVLALGADEARHVGVDVASVTTSALIGVGLLAGAAVGLGGVIGFIGLVAPLVLRSWVGPSHRTLAALSALGGAALLVAIDAVARTAAAPVEIPVGLLTAILGAPVLVWFLLRRSP
jgi:iron complex transport system permease protein